MLVSCLAYSLTLTMEVTCSSETFVNFKRTTRRYIAEQEFCKRRYSVSAETNKLRGVCFELGNLSRQIRMYVCIMFRRHLQVEMKFHAPPAVSSGWKAGWSGQSDRSQWRKEDSCLQLNRGWI
jgi:hypothetical protein